MAHSKQSSPSNKQSKFPILQDAGEFSRGSAGSLLSPSGAGGEKHQLPAGNAEPLEEPRMSRAHGFQPRAHPARCKCTLHSPVGLERLAKKSLQKNKPSFMELSELPAPIPQ